MKTPLECAIKRSGSISALARSLACPRQSIQYWLGRGNPPSAWWKRIEDVTGVSVQRFSKQETKIHD